jgi:hypothetical protein
MLEVLVEFTIVRSLYSPIPSLAARELISVP